MGPSGGSVGWSRLAEANVGGGPCVIWLFNDELMGL
jgi:hypothetical protein